MEEAKPLEALRAAGQSIWLDFVGRGLITGGGLARLIGEDGVTGVTSNPTIFGRASGTEVEWRAVEHDPTIPIPSPAGDGEVAALFDRELAEIRDQLRPGEQLEIGRPAFRSNTSMAIAAFAASPTGDADQLRRALFAA
jgi:transaldolase